MSTDPDDITPPIEVPLEALDSDTLYKLIESFVLREGTDYGSVEVSLSVKVAQVQRQMEKGEVKLVFDATTDTINLMTAYDFRKMCPAL
jgi:uncharacterized protein YheU (UPF0270 family)